MYRFALRTIVAVVFGLVFLLLDSPADARGFLKRAAQTPPDKLLGVDPLPQGCGGVTPPGEPIATCCINGYVFADGEIVEGARVTIETGNDQFVTTTTQRYEEGSAIPYYRFNLADEALDIEVGDTITVSATFSGNSFRHVITVQTGSQQLDIVLRPSHSIDYTYERHIWGQAEPGQFSDITDLSIDVDGNIYATDFSNSRVQVLTSEGVPLRSWGTFGTGQNEFIHPWHLALDNSGHVYVQDESYNRLTKYDGTTGTFLTEFQNYAFGSGIAIDNDYNIYSLSTSGIIKVSPTGTIVAQWGDDYISSTGELDLDSVGNIFISTYTVDQDQDRIFKVSPQGVVLDDWALPKDDITALAIDVEDNVWVTSNTSLVYKYSNDGTLLSSWGSHGTENGELYSPQGMAIDPRDGTILISDLLDRIQRFSPNGAWVATYGEPSHTDGHLNYPLSVAVDTEFNTYITDEGNRVQKFDENGDWVLTWGETGSDAGDFNGAVNIKYSAYNQQLYVVDRNNNRIQRFTKEGGWLGSWFVGTPAGISIDEQGNVYVIAQPKLILKFDSEGNSLAMWQHEEFTELQEIAVDHTGGIYVSDYDFNTSQGTIYRLNPDGTIQWVVNAAYDWITGITVDSENRGYFINYFSEIQVFNPNGQFVTSFRPAGSGIGELDRANGLDMDARGRLYSLSPRMGHMQVYKRFSYTRPIATITHLSSTSLAPSDILVARGLGQDSDVTPAITTYRWTSDRDGVLANNTPVLVAPADTLSPGTHTLTLEVQDSEGEWSAPATATVYVAAAQEADWTMLLYLVGDYHDGGALDTRFTTLIDTLRRDIDNPFIRIAVQVDGRSRGDSRRYAIVPGTPPQVIEIPLEEQAMDDPDTLTAFLRWGQSTFPAEHYYAAIANHGQGLRGIGWDSTSDIEDNGVLDDSAYLTIQELGRALAAPDIAPIDILHLDACSMNLVEVAYEVQAQVDIVIASQYLAWTHFAYDDYATLFGADTAGRIIAQGIVDRYADLSRDAEVPFTISALDTARAGPTLQAIDILGAEMAALVNSGTLTHQEVSALWQASQKYESNGDYENNDLDMYLDVADWADHVISDVEETVVVQRAHILLQELETAATPFIIASDSGSERLPSQYGGAYIDLSRARGLSIYYPPRVNQQDYDDYVNDRLFAFTANSRWKQFLIAGLGTLPPGPLEPPSGPLPPLEDARRMLFLPLVQR